MQLLSQQDAAYTPTLQLAGRRFVHATGAHLMDSDAAMLLKLPDGSLALPRAGRRSARAELDAAHAHLKPYLGPPWPTRCMTNIGISSCMLCVSCSPHRACRQAGLHNTQVQGYHSVVDWRVMHGNS